MGICIVGDTCPGCRRTWSHSPEHKQCLECDEKVPHNEEEFNALLEMGFNKKEAERMFANARLIRKPRIKDDWKYGDE